MRIEDEVGEIVETEHCRQLRELYGQSHDILLPLGISMMGNKPDAEDAIQTVFADMLEWQKPPSDFCKDALAYLCGAVIKQCLLIHRKNKRRRIADLRVEDLEVTNEDVQRAIDNDRLAEETEERLRQAIAAIRPDWAEMLVLHHAKGLTEKAIAAMLGKSRGQVTLSLFRARRKVRKLMRAAGEMR